MESAVASSTPSLIPGTQAQPSSSTPLMMQIQQVAPVSEYFLLMDINGVLISTFYGMVGKEKTNSMHTRVRDGLRDFLLRCVSNFTVVFWTSMNSDNLERHFRTILSHVPELFEDCPRFAQNWCDRSTYVDPANVDRPWFLKRIARLLGDSAGYGGRGATMENTLLVDDTPYKNVLNDPYNAVHPQTFTFTSEKRKKKPYLLWDLWPFLQALKESGLPVREYCRRSSRFGTPRLFPGDEEYERFKTAVPKDRRGFEDPYVGPPMPGAPYTNVVNPADT